MHYNLWYSDIPPWTTVQPDNYSPLSSPHDNYPRIFSPGKLPLNNPPAQLPPDNCPLCNPPRTIIPKTFASRTINREYFPSGQLLPGN